MITLSEFINKYNGKGIDFDGHYGFQCQDLYRQYVQEVLGFPQSPGVVGAKDNWDKYLPEYFDRIPNTPTGVPEPGDIMIWGDKYGEFGHVAVVTEATLTTFKCFSQNDPIGSLCGIKLYRTYTPTLGWLHPKTPVTMYRGYDLTNIESMKVCVDQQVKVVEGQLIDKSQYEAIKGQLTATAQQNEDLSNQLGGVRGELATALQKIDSQNKVIQSYVSEDAVQLETLKTFQHERDMYRDVITGTLDELSYITKIPRGSDTPVNEVTRQIEALGSLTATLSTYETKVKDLEAQVKKLTTAKKPIANLTVSEVVQLLLDKLLKRTT